MDVPVISFSEYRAIVAVYARDQKHTLEPIPRLLTRSNQALQTLERYKNRLDEVTASLSTVEVEDLVTLRDVVTVLQRTEMVRRVAEEIELDIVELGVDGRLVRLQLDEQIGRAHVCTPVTHAHLVCRLLLETKNIRHDPR